MSELGGFCSLPAECGGRPSAEERIYGVLARAVGEGGSANDTLDITTIDGLWRYAKAAGLAAIESVEEAAHWQAWPSTVTDMLGEYEEILGIPASFAPENERRQAVIERWTRVIAANYPALTARAEEIDTRASVMRSPEDPVFTVGPHSSYVMEGKVYDDQNAEVGTFMDGRRCSQFPNFSSDYVVGFLLDVPPGSPPLDDIGRSKAELEAFLDETLPAWNDWVVALDLGFGLDTSLLDATAFHP